MAADGEIGRPLSLAPKWVPATRWQEWWLCPLLVSVRHDSAGYRGMGSMEGNKVFWRSADGTFEASICSSIEANGAKPCRFSSKSLYGWMFRFCLELTAGLSRIWNGQRRSETSSLCKDPSFTDSQERACVALHLRTEKYGLVILATTSTRLTFAQIKPDSASMCKTELKLILRHRSRKENYRFIKLRHFGASSNKLQISRPLVWTEPGRRPKQLL